ncbi:hypothetical protein DFJ74DRAFT_365533 [Hyaloraphidium curvatum]|nr:hypothetical protein DFJ74DRAFT_365533 [Hyaloraphidium curvatum]
MADASPPLRRDATVDLQKLAGAANGTASPPDGAVERHPEQNYIGRRLFYATYTTEVIESVLGSHRLSTLIRTLALRKRDELLATSPKKVPPLEDLEKELFRRANRILDNLVANMNSANWLWTMAAAMNNVLGRLYHQGIHLREEEVNELRRWALKAEREKLSLLFLPCHKSHIDYLVLSYLFYRLGISLPAIAAGDNLDIPIVGPILKKLGAWWIKRGNWSADPLYVGVIREYVEDLLRHGQNIEFFVEGTRSRTGKLLNPRFGILKIILEAVTNGNVADCVVVPIYIGYDKVIETGSYVKELLGSEKEKESLKQVVGATSVLSLRLGRIDIRFAKPYLLSSFINEEKDRARRPNWDPKNNAEHRTILLQAFGFRILSEINGAAVIMPTSLVGTVLLTLRGAQGVGREELIARFEWLRVQILARGGKVADFGGMSVPQVVDRAIEVMRDLIGTRSGLLEPVYYVIKPFELSFYRNQVIQVFLTDSIVSSALYGTVKGIGTQYNPRSILYDDLLQDISFISQLLKTEFIYQPGRLEDITRQTIDALAKADVLALDADSGDEYVTLSATETQNGRENFDFFCFLLWPFLECYWLGSLSCFMLSPDGGSTLEIDEKTFMARTQLLGQTLYYVGDILSIEAVNKETLKNAVMRMREYGILVMRDGPPNSKDGKLISLHSDWVPTFSLPGGRQPFGRPSGRIWELVERIGRFRREGKQRRDNAGTSFRVLKMARLCSESMQPKRKEDKEAVQVAAEDMKREAELIADEKEQDDEMRGVDKEAAEERRGELRERGGKL